MSESSIVPYSKLYCFASRKDKLYMFIGHLAAVITGVGLPSFVFLMGNVIDSFASFDEVLDSIKRISLILVLIGIAIWFFSYIYYAFLLMFSELVGYKLRVEYFRAILRQDIAWFDSINPSELSAKVPKEVMAMQRALGEKMGTIVLSLFMCMSGLAFAFSKGWKFSFVLLALVPCITVATFLFTKV